MAINETRLKSQIISGAGKRHGGTPGQSIEIAENQSTLTGGHRQTEKLKMNSKNTGAKKNSLSKFKDVMIEDYESQKPTSDQHHKSEIGQSSVNNQLQINRQNEPKI